MAPVIVVTIHIAIIPSIVSVIAAFEEIQIVNPVPGHVAREAVTTVQVPMPKFPVSLKPGRKGPRPAIHVIVMRHVRPVSAIVCRCIRHARQKQAYAENQ